MKAENIIVALVMLGVAAGFLVVQPIVSAIFLFIAIFFFYKALK